MDEAERLRIVVLSQDAGWSPTKISRKIPCSRQAVYDVLSKFRQTGTVKDRPGRGRKRKLTPPECKELARQAKKGKPATELARAYRRKTEKEVSARTVERTLHEQGLVNLKVQPVEALSEANKDARLQYCTDMKTTITSASGATSYVSCKRRTSRLYKGSSGRSRRSTTQCHGQSSASLWPLCQLD